MSLFTGSASDVNTAVIATGRNADSGTRLSAVAETAVGVNTALFQYKPTVSGTSITSLAPYPAATVNGVPHVAGDGGESSGGTLRGYVVDTVSQAAVNTVDNSFTTGGFLATYLGMSDFNAVSASGAVQLAYAGIAESQAEIENGAYTFWSYEHLDYKSSITGVKSTVATSLANQIKGSTSATLSPNVSLGDMQVARNGDGAAVFTLNH